LLTKTNKLSLKKKERGFVTNVLKLNVREKEREKERERERRSRLERRRSIWRGRILGVELMIISR